MIADRTSVTTNTPNEIAGPTLLNGFIFDLIAIAFPARRLAPAQLLT